MDSATFHAVSDLLPEPLFLVTGEGLISAANPAGLKLMRVVGGEIGSSLYDFDGLNRDTVARFLRRASRTREPTISGFELGLARPQRFSTEAFLVKPRSSDAPALLLLRCGLASVSRLPFFHLSQKLRELNAEQRETVQALRKAGEARREADTDPLTEMPNRRFFDRQFRSLWIAAARLRTPLSVVTTDLDRFKTLNDSFGHAYGDMCLKAVADVIKTACRRPGDVAARLGGEEFVLALPNTRSDAARHIASTLRAEVAALSVPVSTDYVPVPRITASFGVATSVPDAREPPDTLLSVADHALYAAKRAGRDQVVVSGA